MKKTTLFLILLSAIHITPFIKAEETLSPEEQAKQTLIMLIENGVYNPARPYHCPIGDTPLVSRKDTARGFIKLFDIVDEELEKEVNKINSLEQLAFAHSTQAWMLQAACFDANIAESADGAAFSEKKCQQAIRALDTIYKHYQSNKINEVHHNQ